ncbi:hypothetical protein OG895_37965 [Streptomyces sp. NBC_00201]|uniref:hypothetical protein n=1 Tax=unclassified Streptomyces TaxID=2593676 RepID=UPI00224E8695|nr:MULTISPECIES: hypothetical protein [unclassified Streptomyces]MCX5250919.1 hypothetical protein [Streptomyces sp. NBC_00201]MCX5291152.1 hypothetical protein [Streptomyces sp. NBC_00183]
MSIWSSIPGPDILAVNGADDAANHRAEGEATISIDVATTITSGSRRSTAGRTPTRFCHQPPHGCSVTDSTRR